MMAIMGCQVVTERTGLMLEQSAVVAHTTWLARALAGCLASERSFALLTPSTSRLTLGLARVLEETGSRWVVSDDGRTHYDGFGGALLEWDGQEFDRTLELGEGYLGTGAPSQRGILFRAEALHPPRSTTTVGRLAESLCQLCTGAEPAGWGVVEPVSEPWDVAELTRFVRQESMPRSATVHAVGRQEDDFFASVTSVRRSQEGVLENIVAEWPDGEAWSLASAQRFQDVMHHAGARFAVACRVNRSPGMLRAPHFAGIAEPVSVLLGPQILASRGTQSTLDRLGKLGRLVDRGRWAAVGITYPDPPAHGQPAPAEHHAELIRWLGERG